MTMTDLYWDPFDTEIDSNPYAIERIDGGYLVADAGANALLHVADDGTISTVAVFPNRMVEFPPGSEFDPSNSGYFLLGMVVEKLSGQPLGRYMHEHIFAPAGMTRSALEDALERYGTSTRAKEAIAAAFGVSRATLYRRLREYGL